MIPEAIVFYEEQGEELTPGELARWFEDNICDAEYVGVNKFENIERIVFEHEGHYWSCEFETNAGSGWNEFFGTNLVEDKPPFIKSDDGSWVFQKDNVEAQSFKCTEVYKEMKTIVIWEEV